MAKKKEKNLLVIRCRMLMIMPPRHPKTIGLLNNRHHTILKQKTHLTIVSQSMIAKKASYPQKVKERRFSLKQSLDSTIRMKKKLKNSQTLTMILKQKVFI